MSDLNSSEVLSLQVFTSLFQEQCAEGKCCNITDASLLELIKKRDFKSLRNFLSYFGQSQMLYCARVGFWNKPSELDPVEYINHFSGITRIQQNAAEYCFDVGFISEEAADSAIKKCLLFNGVAIPHFKPCTSQELVKVVHFISLPSSLERCDLEFRLLLGLRNYGRMLFFEQEFGEVAPWLCGNSAIALIAYGADTPVTIPQRSTIFNTKEEVVLRVLDQPNCSICNDFPLGRYTCSSSCSPSIKLWGA